MCRSLLRIVLLLVAPTWPQTLPQALGIHAKVLLASDVSEAAQKYSLHHHKDMMQHVFRNMEDHACGEGPCAVHSQKCTVSLGADCLIAGLCCHAFSTLRSRKGQTPRSGAAEFHPGHTVVFEDFFRVLSSRKPGGFVIEQVPGFSHTIKGETESWLDRFMEKAASTGFAVRVLRADAKTWVARRVGIWWGSRSRWAERTPLSGLS